MDYTVPSAEKGARCYAPSPSMDSFLLFNSIQEPLIFDGNTGWCSNLSNDMMLNFSGFPPSMDLMEQNSTLFLVSDGDSISNVARPSSKDNFLPQEVGVLSFPSESEDKNFDFTQIDDIGSTFNPRTVGKLLTDKLILVLSLFKEFFGGGILAQVWLPVKQKNHYVLSTSDQPYFLDHTLAGYREVSKAFTFSTEGKSGTNLGLPGRVYLSKMPEWTSNVIYYNESEYLRVNHAVLHHVHGSIALPVFDSSDMSCCAVLELVTTKENLDFTSDIEKVGQALQVVNLKTCFRPRFHQESLSQNQKTALAEIHDVLQSVCRIYKLPLALTWIPCSCPEESNGVERVCGHRSVSSGDKCVLCIEESACFVYDKELEGFVDVCAEHCLDKMRGIIGGVLQSNHPFFSIDVKSYDIREYPVVHHARRFGLTAVLAIRVRNVWTGDDDYVLEFFFPVNLIESSEQKALLDNVLSTINSVYKIQSMDLNEKSSGVKGSSADVLCSSNTNQMREAPSVGSIGIVARKIPEGKRNAKTVVNLSTLQKYFSGSLKDAAKDIGVCPTTLKRICRKHGIMRWPSRKINKVNSSLRKIQTVLEAVQGAEGLEFDLSTRQLMSTCKQICFAAASEQGDLGRVEEIDDGTTAACSDARTSSVMTEIEGSSSSQSQNSEQSGLKITVKATYKEDTVRFKFVLSSGCGKLYKEVGRRFKLQVGCFQLKYLDDEQEWVILAGDADLEECADVLAKVGTANARFVVHELS